MPTFTSRAYSSASDLQAMLDFLLALRPPDRIGDYPGLSDLREALALSSVRRNTRLWFGDSERLLGFAYVDPYSNLVFEIAQPEAHPGIAAQVVAWGEACLRRGASQVDSPAMLDASCRQDDASRIALLEQHGFVRQAFCALKFYRPLDEPVPTPQVPPGFHISHAAGEQDVEALVALHRAAFGTQTMTVEERLAMMRQPGYDPALDLLARAPDGRLAAYCFCSVSLEENQRSGRKEGCTDPVATHPDFQRRGLGLALLLTGLHALKQRGMQAAVLGTGSDNIAMQRLAQAAGFRVRSATLWFSKPVPPQG